MEQTEDQWRAEVRAATQRAEQVRFEYEAAVAYRVRMALIGELKGWAVID